MEYKFPERTRFLVTGGAGFIGSNLVEELLHLGYYVRVLDNFMTGKRENIREFMDDNNFELIEGDIRDFDTCMTACNNIDYVFHEAALGSVPRSIKDPLLSNDVNVSGFLNMVYAAKENKVKGFIYASSSSVYGDSAILPKVEGTEGSVLSPYALTKKADEMYATLFNKLYDLPTVGLRYFNVYGPKQDPESIYAAVIPIFINKLINNEEVTINGDGTNSRDFTYVEDVVQANIKACLCSDKCRGNIYNIGYGGRTTIAQLYDDIRIILSRKEKIHYSDTREGDVQHSYSSIKKAHDDFDYIPKYNIDSGLKKTVGWYHKKKN